jgi:hypothetical protein
MSAGAQSGHRGSSRSHEGIEDGVVLVGVKIDEAPRQFDRERSRMAHATGTLWGYLPKVGGGLEKLVTPDGGG